MANEKLRDHLNKQNKDMDKLKIQSTVELERLRNDVMIREIDDLINCIIVVLIRWFQCAPICRSTHIDSKTIFCSLSIFQFDEPTGESNCRHPHKTLLW